MRPEHRAKLELALTAGKMETRTLIQEVLDAHGPAESDKHMIFNSGEGFFGMRPGKLTRNRKKRSAKGLTSLP
jgi:hypothetical protein